MPKITYLNHEKDQCSFDGDPFGAKVTVSTILRSLMKGEPGLFIKQVGSNTSEQDEKKSFVNVKNREAGNFTEN